jgi:hypothetical protein
MISPVNPLSFYRIYGAKKRINIEHYSPILYTDTVGIAGEGE